MIYTDRNLLFGILAVQMNFVSRDALIAGMHGWLLAKHRTLGQILVEQGSLATARHELLERLVEEHLSVSEADAERSLAGADVLGAVRPAEAGVADTEPVPGADAIGGDRLPRRAEIDETLPYLANAVADTMRFALLRPHAKGGLGQVWVALDRELNREVALKEIRPEQADDPESRARFLLEAEVTGRLEHPGIVPVYGLGCNAEGRPFYAMRFIKGQSLKEAIAAFHQGLDSTSDWRRWSLGLRSLLNRFIAVCNVVAYAHSRGVVHRDLKSSNILLGPYGETLVVDWGLAKVVGRDEAATGSAPTEATLRPASQSGSSETLPGLAMGTPAYMSPEQAEGRLDDISPLSDVYSLGATLYSVLTGYPPFRDADVLDVLRRVRNGDIVPPRQVNRRVPAALEAVCLKAMALRRQDRYDSARSLAYDLERWLADEPISVHREPWSTRLTRWGRRHRTLASGIGILLVTAVIGLTLGNLLLGQANERIASQRAVAEDQRKVAELKTREVDDKARALEDQLYVNRINLAQREAASDIVGAERLLDQCAPNSRGWEWHYVKRLCHQERRTFQGHTRPVNAVAFSPDGRRLVSGAGERYYNALATDEAELFVRDAESGRILRRLTGLQGAVFSVAFSRDGQRFAVGSGYQREINNFDGHLSVWEAESGHRLYDRLEEGESLLSLAFSPDGRYIAAGYGRYSSTRPGRFKLWEAAEGKEVRSIPAPPGGVNAVAFHPDGRRVALACSGVVEIWDAIEPRKVGELRGHTSWIYAVAFNRDGTRLATGGWDRTLRIWDVASGTTLLATEEHGSAINAVTFSPDGARLASCTEGHNLRVWDAATGRAIATLRGHALGIPGLAYSSDGRWLATASEDRSVKLWDMATDYPITFRDHKGWVTGVSFSRDGQYVLSSSGDRSLMTWDPATGRRRRALPPHNEWILAAALDPDDRHAASTSADFDIRLWDLAAATPTYTGLGPSFSFPLCVAFSPDGARLAVGSGPGRAGSAVGRSGSVRIWQVATGQEIVTYRSHRGGISALAFSPDGRTIASVGGDQPDDRGEARIWNAATGEDRYVLSGHDGVVNAVAFSPDGSRLATGANDATVKIWDAASGRLIRSLEGHSQPVICIAFAPDGTRLASGGNDRVIKIWDIRSGADVLTLRGHSGGITSLAYSPDGRRLVSGSSDWTARVWNATPLDDTSIGQGAASP